MRMHAPTVGIGVLLLGLLLAACGGGGTVPLPAPRPAPPEDPVVPLDPVAVWTDAGCGACHGADGASGFAPVLTCFAADGIDAYVRSPETPHVGGVSDLTDDEIAAIAAHLDAGCTSHVPASHDVGRGSPVVHHRAGLDTPETSCAPCHGPSLEGHGTVPSCAACHAAAGGGTFGCTTCHATTQDNGVGAARRAVVAEFAAVSHHLSDGYTDDDCKVCHDMSDHQGGTVRLRNVDDPTDVFVLEGDPFSSASEAAKLEAFCLACHDADAAGGATPFSDGITPTPVSSSSWYDGVHAGGQLTCTGNGSSIGCHGTGHGSAKRALLAPAAGSTSGVTGDATREEEGFCYQCHTDGGLATSDVEAAFALTSHHLIGSTEQGSEVALECTSCHDPHAASSDALLCDPSDGTAWTGTINAFCVACHGTNPPDTIGFPSATTGSGWDKSAFAGTAHATNLGDDACMDCHSPHGSTYESLLLGEVVVANSNTYAAADYALCWDCHSASTIVTGTNAFGELHKKHVQEEGATCASCHDVHASYDSGERGLISFLLASNASWGYAYPSGTTLSSAFVAGTTSGGSCSIRCHGEWHTSTSYSAGN